MAKRFTCEGIARVVLLSINGLFFALGAAVLILSVFGFSYFFSSSSSASSVISSFDLPAFNLILVVTACVTIGLALLGVYGAWRYALQLLKLYLLALLAIISIQIAMGIYLLTLNMDDVRTSWNQETPAARQSRVDIQNSLTCCGYDTWTDSIGYLHTPCPYAPTAPVSAAAFRQPQTCQVAVRSYVDRWLVPVAVAAIVLAVVEIMAVGTVGFIIFRQKERHVKTGFEY